MRTNHGSVDECITQVNNREKHLVTAMDTSRLTSSWIHRIVSHSFAIMNDTPKSNVFVIK